MNKKEFKSNSQKSNSQPEEHCLAVPEKQAGITRGELSPGSKSDNGNNQAEKSDGVTLISDGPEVGFGGKDGNIPYFNQVRVAAGFAVDHFLKYDTKRSYIDYVPDRGIWKPIERPFVKGVMLSSYLRRIARSGGSTALEREIENDLLDDLIAVLPGFAATEFVANNHPGVIHFKNCMLATNETPFKKLPFSPEFNSTRQLPFVFDPSAKCPRYLRWMDDIMDKDDQAVWAKYGGMVMSGLNTAQKIMILSGIGLSGKSALVGLTSGLVGRENIFEFRARNLGLRFEMAKLIDKSLLIGSDVESTFLSQASAHYLKSLTGQDPISAELKNVSGSVLLSGEFNVLMVSNTDLRVKLEGDAEAWRRRLIMISFPKQVENPIPNFAKSILDEEAPGIINVWLGGLAALQREGLTLTPDQRARVDGLLGESDSVRSFIQDEVHLDPEGDVTTDELVRAHERYCHRRSWIPRSNAIVEKEIHKVLVELYNSSRRHDVLRGATQKRGFSGFRIISSEPYQSDVF